MGYEVVTGGTDNHLFLLDFSKTHPNVSGRMVQDALDANGITLNKNCVQNEKRSPMQTSGVRIGTSGLPATLPARIFDIRFIAPANSIAGNSLKLVTEGSVISIKMINGKAVPANIWAKGSVVQLSINNTGTTPTATLSGGGGSSGHLVSATAPDDTSVLWIDSANGYFAKIWDGSKWVGISAAWG